VTIIDGVANLGTLLPGTEKVLHNDLSFSLSGDIPDNAAVTFDLKIKYGTIEKLYKIDVYIHSPDLRVIRYIIDDSETGNGNFIADPGETIRFIFSVINLGSSNVSGLIRISSPDSEISIIEPTKSSGILNSGTIIDIPLQAKISASAASGTIINMTAELDCDPYFADRSFSFRIGQFQETFESSSFKIFPWINISAKPWTINQSDPYEGIIAAKSGGITHNQSSALGIRAYYHSADSLRFYYNVSSEAGYDLLIFKLNNVEIFRKSGEIPWSRKAVGVPAGMNKFEWIYKKDGSVSAGADCAMIDLIDFAGASTVNYIARDIMTAKLISPLQSTSLDQEKVTVKLLNLGPNTIKGFNMAYYINNGMPVIEHFNDSIIYNGDTVTVTFAIKADLSNYGDYELVVFSFANNDDYLLNDTLTTIIKNRMRRQSENVRIEYVNPLIVGPNPFSEALNILIDSNTEEKVHISLVSSAGKKVMDKDYHLVVGSNPVIINGAGLEPAVYFLNLEFSGYSRTIKVIKLKGY
jgi:hypothetical protein